MVVSSRARQHGALSWLQEQKFDHPAHQIALQEMVEAVRISKEMVERLDAAIEEFLQGWSLAPIVQALQALRGVDVIVAVTFATEIGDMRRFDSPRQLMGYLGLVPSERSTGDTVRRGGITKTGNGRVRHMLVESAWTYRHPPRIGKTKLYRLEAVSPRVRRSCRKINCCSLWKRPTRSSRRARPRTKRRPRPSAPSTPPGAGRTADRCRRICRASRWWSISTTMPAHAAGAHSIGFTGREAVPWAGLATQIPSSIRRAGFRT